MLLVAAVPMFTCLLHKLGLGERVRDRLINQPLKQLVTKGSLEKRITSLCFSYKVFFGNTLPFLKPYIFRCCDFRAFFFFFLPPVSPNSTCSSIVLENLIKNNNNKKSICIDLENLWIGKQP